MYDKYSGQDRIYSTDARLKAIHNGIDNLTPAEIDELTQALDAHLQGDKNALDRLVSQKKAELEALKTPLAEGGRV